MPEGDEAVCVGVVKEAVPVPNTNYQSRNWGERGKEEGEGEGRNKRNRIKNQVRKRSHVSRATRVETPDCIMHLIMHELERGASREAGRHFVVVYYVEAEFCAPRDLFCPKFGVKRNL